jgi:hypothetical protein
MILQNEPEHDEGSIHRFWWKVVKQREQQGQRWEPSVLGDQEGNQTGADREGGSGIEMTTCNCKNSLGLLFVSEGAGELLGVL